MSKTSYTIPEVAKILHISEAAIVSWGDQGKLKISKVNLENCVYREDLILFMKRVGLSTEALEAETPPTKEEELKNLLYRERVLIYRLLKEENRNLAGSGGGCEAILEEMKSLGILEGK